MSDKHSGAKAPTFTADEERATRPPPSAVGLSRAERKRAWARLLKSAAEAAHAGASLAPVCERARPITRHVGRMAMGGLSLLLVPEKARGAIIDAAAERFFRRMVLEPPLDLDPERLFLHAVRQGAVAWLGSLPGGAPEEPAARADEDAHARARALTTLDHAWTQALELPRLQQRVLLLCLTLDSIMPLFSDDRPKNRSPWFFVGLALGLRENSVHQHAARIRKKLLPEGTAHLGVDAFDALRCLWAPPSALARAALAYVEGYREGESRGSSEALHDRCAAYEAHLRASREASVRARQAWREVVAALDASGTEPAAVHGPLLAECELLGIDDRLGRRARGSGQRWADLLPDGESCRPVGARRAAWRRFLQRHLPRAAEAHARFSVFEERSRVADAEREAKLEASKALFNAAAESDTTRAITRLLDLLSEAQAELGRG